MHAPGLILPAHQTAWRRMRILWITAALLAAAAGDNSSKRESCTLHILHEPALPVAGVKLAATVTAAWQIQFCYEGGPRDCEAVAVDTKAGQILLISKRTEPPEVYQLPLRPAARPYRREIPAQQPHSLSESADRTRPHWLITRLPPSSPIAVFSCFRENPRRAGRLRLPSHPPRCRRIC